MAVYVEQTFTDSVLVETLTTDTDTRTVTTTDSKGQSTVRPFNDAELERFGQPEKPTTEEMVAAIYAALVDDTQGAPVVPKEKIDEKLPEGKEAEVIEIPVVAIAADAIAADAKI